MKLINYKRGYNSTFDCSIHGTIKINREEYYKIVHYLYSVTTKLWNKDILYSDLARRIHIDKNKKFLINIRSTATKLLADKFNLTNYKAGNYQIEVTN